MRDNVKMIKLKSGLIRFNGSISYWTTDYKTVEVDGETYTKTSRREVETTLAKMRVNESNKMHFHNYEYDFDLLDVKLKIEEYSGWTYGSLSTKASRYDGSQNGYVRAIQCAKEFNLLPDVITNIYTDKTTGVDYYHSGDEFQRILKSMEVTIRLCDYGFNNSIYYKIKLKDFFNIPFDRIPDRLKDIFSENGINLKAKNKVNEVAKILTKKVKL